MTFIEGSYGPPPLARLDAEDLLRCFDPACDAAFGKRAEDGSIVFAPGWVYQGTIWRDRSIQDELAGDEPDASPDQLWAMVDRMPRNRNEPNLRETFVSSRLPAYVLCPSCRHLQSADPDILDAAEATTSLVERRPGLPRWLDRLVSRVVVRLPRRRRRSP